MSTRIQILPQDVTLKIAAGEVVERPAAAVKELIDNAVDAGASWIRIDIREAGLKTIRVTDDGDGIARHDLPLAFHPHATSKIQRFSDLDRLSTLGFRGEALASIAAVSRIEVQTRSAGEEIGSRLTVMHGEPATCTAQSTPVGTRITVSDLFANVPARRRFVRSTRAETARIGEVITAYALAQPSIRFSLTVDGRPTFESPGTGKLRDAVAAVLEPAVLDDLMTVQHREPGVDVTGLAGKPTLHRPTRSGIHIFVNGRPVENRRLVFALEEAYSGYLMTGRHPIAILSLSLPAADVDVNIHPSKSEVRFVHEREVHGAVYRAVTGALSSLRPEVPETPVEVVTGSGTPLLALPEPASAVPAPALRVFGQSNRTFIIAEGPDGLYMIDQHAAHERVLFDRLTEQITQRDVPVQPLLEPAAADLTPEQTAALDENRELLIQAGFHIEPFGDRSCLIRAVPAIAARSSPGELVSAVLSDLASTPRTDAAYERTLATMACKAAVKAGDLLDTHEMRELVVQLESTAHPQTCPHGRPTMIRLSHAQLEREFGRR
ncbi:MAG TPA: DNA mismatch repair endonuclease MutL [Chloroflexota bacterium]|nr:DNA mismatch repair endonuclease MutL [Chloroflexota bacterium]